MNKLLSKRMQAFQPSIFSELAAYKKRKIEHGCDMIDLSIGSPDMPPPDFVVDCLTEAAVQKECYGYTLTGTQEFHEAVASYYENNYKISLNSLHEIVMLMGSQDGLVHLPMVFADPGDYILVPDPGYTAYATGIAMAGATPYFMPLTKENGFLPDLSQIPEHVARQTKLMILNFPGNPVPVMADEAFFHEVIAFAKRYDIIVIHDFAYGELYFDNNKPISFLSVPGAKEIGVEINSLSKSFNLAGCRIGYLAGNESIIETIKHFKSNIDYGVFLPIQKAAIAALRNGAAFCEQNRMMYEHRRNVLAEGLCSIGWQVQKSEGGMFIWAEIPAGWTSTQFAYALMDKASVVVTPGQAFGPSGEGFVRIALVQDEKIIKEAVVRLKNSGIFA
ncbi:LL-diaminopimelate aminotransferase [Ectobacillus panaciterrae]|uniref:LL-diaminopimelate aminotransferase n=1 Tax=Ectobacillus panaciterrae TaxID=363872 RepID=UPI0003FD3550|nr:LL-diaminopimelate aminotransferase [Ectobacillus panaciterrae]